MAKEDCDTTRTYEALGCLTVFFLPAAMLSSHLYGTLTWLRVAAYVGLAALLMAAPLFFAGRKPTDE